MSKMKDANFEQLEKEYSTNEPKKHKIKVVLGAPYINKTQDPQD